MSFKRNFINEYGKDISVKENRIMSLLGHVIMLVSILISSFACTQQAITTGFDPSKLKQLGDRVCITTRASAGKSRASTSLFFHLPLSPSSFLPLIFTILQNEFFDKDATKDLLFGGTV